MQEWESRLTKQQMDYAMQLAIVNGWSSESPPIWVWAQIFREAELKYPSRPNLKVLK